LTHFPRDRDPDYVLDSPERSLAELELFWRAGGGTLVEAMAADRASSTS
jgi:hypothetical protein